MLNIAHRGASGYAPENTRAAFERAIAMGADSIETDVRLTCDGELVLMHDATVTRTTDGHGPVADHTLAELQALDAGRWFAAEHAGERVLILEEFCEEFVPRTPVVLEVKDVRATTPLVEAVQSASIGDRIHVTSFDWSALMIAKAIDPTLMLGFLSPVFDSDIIRRCVRRGFAQICPRIDTLTGELVAEAHDSGLFVRAWGISSHEQVDLLFDTNANGATINWPDWIPDHRQ